MNEQPENYNEDGGVVSCGSVERIAAARAAIERDLAAGTLGAPPVHHGHKVRSYDPKSVRITFNGVEIRGFAEVDLAIDHEPGHPDFDPNFSGAGSLSITLVQHGHLKRVTTRRQHIRAARRRRKLCRGWA